MSPSLKAETGSYKLTGSDIALTHDGANRTAINDFRGSSTCTVSDGHIEIEVNDGPDRGRKNEPKVLKVLAAAASGKLMTVLEGDDSRGIDARIQFEARGEFFVQIVSVPTDPEYWKKVSTGKSTVSLSFDEAAAWIHESIEKKNTIAKADRAKIILALDARHCAQLAHDAVIAALMKNHPDPATHGFAEVWLVGPVVGRSRRLA